MMLSVVVFGVFSPVSAEAPNGQITIRVKGSDDMAGRVDTFSKVFMKDNPNVSVVVSGGSSAAFPDFLERNCEVLMLGHHLSDEQKNATRAKGIQLNERLVGYGAIAFLTYPQNPVDEVTVEQLRKLMIGDLTWKQVGGNDEPVVVVSVETMTSDTRMFVLRDFLAVPAVRSKVERITSFRTIAKKVAETQGALGFCRLRDVEGPQGSEVKVLKIKNVPDSPAVAPSRTSIADGSYPIRRPFSLCFDSKGDRNVEKLVDFIVSKGWTGAKPQK